MSLRGMLKWELRDWRPLAASERELDPDDPVPMFGSVFRGHSAVMDSHGISNSDPSSSSHVVHDILDSGTSKSHTIS